MTILLLGKNGPVGTELQRSLSLIDEGLAQAVRPNALLVHYSTDYVLDGAKEGAYVEDGIPTRSLLRAQRIRGSIAPNCVAGLGVIFLRGRLLSITWVQRFFF